MRAMIQNICRTYMRWLAKHFPWYIKLIAGKHADDILRRMKEWDEDSRAQRGG